MSSSSGQDAAVVAKIDRFLQARLAKSNIPGLAVAVVTKDSVLLLKGYGVSAGGQLVTSKTPFAIASLSKAFTAMSVMQLVAKHKINLADPVKNYIPFFKLNDPRVSDLTIDHLLHQTSGLNDQVFPELSFYNQPSSLNEAISRMKPVVLASEPGMRYRYHNPNYQILAKVVESAGRQPFPSYLQQHIFTPLKMDNTRDVASTKAFSNTSFQFRNGHIFIAGLPLPIQEPDWFVEGAAGMVSNAEDMSKWLRVQLNNGRQQGVILLDSIHLKAMQTPAKTSSYGMGWFVNKDKTLNHSGILWTYSSEQMITANGYGIVVLFNSGINPFEDYHSFIQGVADIIDNKTPDMPLLPGLFFPLFTCFIIILCIAVATRRLLRLNHWIQNYKRRPAWQTMVLFFARMLPTILFLCIPALITAASGRVLNWKRILLMAPDLIIGLAVISLLNALIVARRVSFMIKSDKK